MKQYIAALALLLLILLCGLPALAAAPALTTTEAYCIMDAETGLVLAEQNMNERLHPASTTKVMTLGLACEKAAGSWDVDLTVSHEDVYSLAGTDSSHIALREEEVVPLEDILYATAMASANDGANVLASYFGGGTIAGGVEQMNAQAAELGLQNTHFVNPHGISDEEHYTSCYDLAQILRWALQQPGFETVFTRSEIYTMPSTNLQPVTRYFSLQDLMRVGSSQYYIPYIVGSKTGYTNIARYNYVCLAEYNGLRLICVAMRSELKIDKYNDLRTLMDYAFSTWTGYTEIPAGAASAQLEVRGGGPELGGVTVTSPGISLPLAAGLSTANVEIGFELPEVYTIGEQLNAYAVYTVTGGLQAEASVRVPVKVEGLSALFEQNRGRKLDGSGGIMAKGLRWSLVLGAVVVLLGAAAAARFLLHPARAGGPEKGGRPPAARHNKK